MGWNVAPLPRRMERYAGNGTSWSWSTFTLTASNRILIQFWASVWTTSTGRPVWFINCACVLFCKLVWEMKRNIISLLRKNFVTLFRCCVRISVLCCSSLKTWFSWPPDNPQSTSKHSWSNFTPQVKQARNQWQIFDRKSISRNTTHRHLLQLIVGNQVDRYWQQIAGGQSINCKLYV